VSTLHRVATALQVPITAFFEDRNRGSNVIVSRPGERSYSGSGSMLLESLGSGLPQQTLQPFVVTLKPGADSGPSAIIHAGHELVFCLQGELEYRIDGQTYRLAPGESLLFEARLPHCWCNPSDADPVTFLLVFQSVETGEPLEQHLHP
jgi:quercetin dioxygenase-like cupin family protein